MRKLLIVYRFQWAALHLAHLLSLDRPSDIARTLQGLPRGLEKTYGEIFERITSPDNSLRDIAIRTLLWMLSQNGIANVDQTLVIACQDLSNDDINQVDIDIETVIKACQNLIVVENGFDFSAPHNFSTSIPGENEPLSPVPGIFPPIPPVPNAPPSPPPGLHGSCTTAYRPRFVVEENFDSLTSRFKSTARRFNGPSKSLRVSLPRHAYCFFFSRKISLLPYHILIGLHPQHLMVHHLPHIHL